MASASNKRVQCGGNSEMQRDFQNYSAERQCITRGIASQPNRPFVAVPRQADEQPERDALLRHTPPLAIVSVESLVNPFWR